MQSNFLKKIFHIFPVSKPTVSLCVMYEVKLGWKWCTPRFQRTRRRESLSTDQVRYKNKINQCMGESSFGFGLDPNYFMVWCGILDGLLVKCGGGRGWTIERCVIIYENADLRNKLSENCTSFSGIKKARPYVYYVLSQWNECHHPPLGIFGNTSCTSVNLIPT